MNLTSNRPLLCKCLLVFGFLALAGSPLLGCKSKDDKKQASSKPSILGKIEKSASSLAGGLTGGPSQKQLLNSLPGSAAGAIHFDLSSSGFDKLVNSVWVQNSQNNSLKNSSNPLGLDIEALLAEQGIKLDKLADLKKVSKEAMLVALEVAPTAASSGNKKDAGPLGTVALSMRAADSLDLQKFSNGLVGQLEKNTLTTLKAEGDNPKVYSVSVNTKEAATQFKNNASAVTKNLPPQVAAQFEQALKNADAAGVDDVDAVFRLGWNKDTLVIGQLEKTQIAGLIDGNGKKIALSSVLPSELSSGWGSDSSRFMSGFADVVRLSGDNGKSTSARFVSLSSWMDDSLHSDIRISWDKSAAPQSSNFRLLESSGSTSSSFDKAPSDSFLVANFDGKFLDQLVASGSVPGGAAFAGNSEGVKSVSLSARVAKPGQFMFPIPALTLSLNASNPDMANQLKKQLISLGVMGSQLSGGVLPLDSSTGGMLTKKVAGVDVSYLASPFGPGLYLASSGNNVYLATDEPGLAGQISPAKGSGLSGIAKGLFKSSGSNPSKTLGTFYIDYKKLADFSENMAGLAASYGSSNPFTPEMIEEMRKYGHSYGTLENSDGIFRLYSKSSES